MANDTRAIILQNLFTARNGRHYVVSGTLTEREQEAMCEVYGSPLPEPDGSERWYLDDELGDA